MKRIIICLLFGVTCMSAYSQLSFNEAYKAAQEGRADVQAYLGYMYLTGTEVEKNEREAFKWFHKSAFQGNADGQCYLGLMYVNGWGVLQNVQEAFNWFQEAAQQGNNQAQYYLGWMYCGNGIPQNIQEAIKWFKKAAEQGNVSAYLDLGLAYYKGEGVKQNYQEAFNWLLKSAQAGDSRGQAYIGNMYRFGNGTPKNEKEAFKWTKMSAEQGYDAAQYDLAHMYFNAFGTQKNDIEAFKWYKKAAEQGLAWGQYSLGWMYLNGAGTPKNETEAFYWLLKAAEQGISDAQVAVGHCYFTGEGVEKNFMEAFRWTKMAAESGNAYAQSNLSGMYFDGKGTDIDYEEAYNWAKKSADQNYTVGLFCLAQCYTVGNRKDSQKAIECLDKAIELQNNNKDVQKNFLLHIYNFKGKIYLEEKDFAKAEEMGKLILSINPQYENEDDNQLMVYMQTGKVEADNVNLAQVKRAKPSSDVDVAIPKMPIRNSNTFAVIIANENYEEETQVEYALNDGEIFKAYCQDVLGLPETNIHYRENATLNNILAELDWMKQISSAFGSEAKFIFYYAGHGVPDEATGDSYLLPVDGRGNMLATGYSLKKLYDTLGGLTAKDITVFMDACFSGAVRDGGMMASARGVAIKAKQAAPKGNMIVLSAAQGDETAYPYKEKGHGLFTYHLLKKLQETKGNVTMGELADYITSEVKKRSIVVNGKLQTPVVTFSNSAMDWRNWKLK